MNAVTLGAAFDKRKSVLIALLIAVAIIVALSLSLEKDSIAAAMLLDHQTFSVFPYPLTIQNLTYLIFAAGLGDMWNRWRVAKRERAYLEQDLLPEDATTVLAIEDLGPVRRKVANLYKNDEGFLPYLLDLSIVQLQSSHSVDQAVSMLTSSLDLLSHRVDMRYQMARYIAWLIPTIGFIGTVIGIAVALEYIDPSALDIKKVTGGLAVAFYTTLIALIVGAILVFVQNMVQKEEEIALNDAGQYCLRNLINRIYVPDEGKRKRS